jgi:uncharacterized RDD family membrane protein YckC
MNKILPLHLDNNYENIYGSFGIRFGAVVLDGLLLAPFSIVMLVFNSMRLNNYYYTFVVSQLFILLYFIYLPVRYGATPGKRILGLTILKRDGSTICYRESFLKYLPSLSIGLIAFVMQCYSIALADDDTFNSLGWIQQSNYLKSFNPIGLWIQIGVVNAYYLTNVFALILNDRNRSIGDQLASTVVVYTHFLDKIKEWQPH